MTAPQHRLDVEGPHDLIEEIARIYGYDRLPSTLMDEQIPPARGNPSLEFEEMVRDLLVEAGLQEIVSYRLTTPAAEARLFAPGTPPDDRPFVTVQNPMSAERVTLRHGLGSGLVEAVVANLRHHDRVALFEIGSVYLPSESGELPDELPRAAIAMSGKRLAGGLPWNVAPALDFFDLKGVVEALLDGLHIRHADYEPLDHPSYFPGRAAAVAVNRQRVGIMGELHPRVRWAWEPSLAQPILTAEFDLEALRAAWPGRTGVADVSRFPAVNEDLSIVVSEDVPAAEVQRAILSAGGALVRQARLFDVYRGEQTGLGKKSLAFALVYQADDRTLADKEIEKVRSKIIRSVEAQLGAVVRR